MSANFGQMLYKINVPFFFVFLPNFAFDLDPNNLLVKRYSKGTVNGTIFKFNTPSAVMFYEISSHNSNDVTFS